MPDIQKHEVPKNHRPKSQDTKKTEAPSKVRLTPAETVSKAAAKVTRLEAALAALEDSDDADGAEATALKEALKKARAQAAPSNPGRRLDECQQYVARAARRLEKAKAAVAEAQQLEQLYQEQLVAGFADLEVLRKRSILSPTDGSFRRQFRVEGPPPTGGPIEARTRCVDVDFRRPPAHGRIGNTIRRSFDVDVGSDRGWRCKAQMCGNPSAMQAVIVGEFCSMTCGPARNARCGLRGVRVGEASHPGPGAGFVCTCDEATTGSAPFLMIANRQFWTGHMGQTLRALSTLWSLT